MQDKGGPVEPLTGLKYRAFISYSHHDTATARSIHRALENYVLPRRLVGTATARGVVPARLTPVFRDREELSAGEDLSRQVQLALAQSAALIVVCSPHARASKWVSKEIEAYRALHPDGPVLAALIEGEPDEAFPDLLTIRGGALTEPSAADFRKGKDGRKLAQLKLVAGLTGVGLDALVQRDHQRYQRRVMAVTLVAGLALIVMGLLLMMAVRARNEAEHQRGQAEGLIEYMLTDLRTRLKGVGRLDVMTAVNERAMLYYGDQAELTALPTESLERRARVLLAMGEDDELRGDAVSARNKFKEAHRTTAALLARDPSNPERMFAHAQSEYWVGYLHHMAGRTTPARIHYDGYLTLAKGMVNAAPANPKYVLELGYAYTNLCSLAFGQAVPDLNLAARSCPAAEQAKARVVAMKPGDEGALGDHANSIAWLADYYREAGRMREAEILRHRQEKIINGQIARDPDNMDLRDVWVTVQLGLAEIERRTGRVDVARARLRETATRLEAMIAFDPANKQWKNRAKIVAYKLRHM